jgi:hypothetical protein
MSVNAEITVYIVAKTKIALLVAKKRLLDAAFPDGSSELLQSHREIFEEGFTQPSLHDSVWHTECSTGGRMEAILRVWMELDGMVTDNYVVYGEMPGGDSRCPELGIHFNTNWFHANTEAAYKWMAANYA